jgi:hypothetical protein
VIARIGDRDHRRSEATCLGGVVRGVAQVSTGFLREGPFNLMR